MRLIGWEWKFRKECSGPVLICRGLILSREPQAMLACESLMHSKRPGRIDRCRLGSTRSDTGAFLLRFLVEEIGPISLNKAFWEVLTMEFVWNIIF